MNDMDAKSRTVTVGEESLRLYGEDPGSHSAVDQMREQLKDYEENVFKCVQDNKDKYQGDFYVVVLTKKERLMQNVLRGYFFARSSCPTPDYDQAVYKCFKKDSRLELLWVIPAADVVNLMKNNPHLVEKSKYGLLGYVLKFADGSLLRQAKELNGEKRDSNILEK
jgi:hypothetical protein